jgi:DDE superfamily endonuclease
VAFYRVRLDVPRELVLFVSGLLAARRRGIGTRKCTRKLGCYRQALFALAWFRDKGDIPRLGAGFGLAPSTAYRYLDEAIGVVAARAPGLQEALERALAEGTPYVILDGKIVPSDRCREKTVSRKGREIDVWCSGKRHDFGGNVQAVFYPSGIPMWVSDELSGNVHDLAAARENVLAALRPFLDAMPALADSGYEGAGHGVHVPVKRPRGVKELDINNRTRNALLTSARCLGERGFALLSQRWQTLQDVTASPGKKGLIARAALVLVLFEHKMLNMKVAGKLTTLLMGPAALPIQPDMTRSAALRLDRAIWQ